METINQTPEEKNLIYEFLRQQSLGVISVFNSKTESPESALVAFAETETLEIIFGTMQFARKYESLKSSPKISFVTGLSSSNYVTLQYEGIAKEVVGEEEKECKEILSKKDTPCTEEFLSNQNFKMFKIAPAWISFSDYTKNPPHIIEIRF
jgi:hypothetical protein